MKKILVPSLVLIMILGIVAFAAAQADDIPRGTSQTNAIIQNTATGPGENASLIVKYYNEAGAEQYTNSSVSIAPKSVKEIKTADEPLPAGFVGAAVISSDRPLAAVTSIRNNNVPGASDGFTQGAYNGATAGADTLYFATFWGFSGIVSRATVQNTSGNPADITLQFYDREGTDLGTKTATLAAYGSRTFCACDANDLPAGWPANFQDGSITVTTDDGAVLAGASVATWPNRSGAYQALIAADRGTTLYVPAHYRFKNNVSQTEYTLFSAVNIQNTSATTPADVTVEYYNRSNGALALTLNETIPAGSTLGLNTKNGGDLDPSAFNPLGQQWDGTVKIISDDGIELVGTVITNWGLAGHAGMSAMPSNNTASNTLFLPAQYRLAPGGTYSQWSSLNLQNVGGSTVAASDLTIQYLDNNGAVIETFSGTDLFDLEAGAGIGLNTRNGGDLEPTVFNTFGTGYIGGIYVSAPAGSELVATANIIYQNRASVYNGQAGQGQ